MEKDDIMKGVGVQGWGVLGCSGVWKAICKKWAVNKHFTCLQDKHRSKTSGSITNKFPIPLNLSLVKTGSMGGCRSHHSVPEKNKNFSSSSVLLS